MLWYKKLYTGEMAEKGRFGMIQKIRSGKAPAFTYLIVPAANEKNLLDIYPASEICGREEKWSRINEREPLILGIALGYQDALKLAGRMVEEVYTATGGFDIRSYLGVENYYESDGAAAGTGESELSEILGAME